MTIYFATYAYVRLILCQRERSYFFFYLYSLDLYNCVSSMHFSP